MLINKTLKPWATASTDKKFREILSQFCYLEAKDSLLISTDGRALVQLPVTVEEGDLTGNVPVEALKAAVKLCGRLPEARIDCTSPDHVKLSDGRTWPRACPGRTYPQWRQVLPDYSQNSGRRTVRLQINPVLLANLFTAMGDPESFGAILQFEIDEEWDGHRSPIVVESSGMSGILMPMRIQSRAPNRIQDIAKAHEVALVEEANRKPGGDPNAADLKAAEVVA